MTTPLENAATRNNALIVDAFNRRDLDAALSAWDANARYDDRRKGLRDAGQMDRVYATHLLFDAPTSWQMEFEPVAIRGRHLALTRLIWRDTAEADRAVAVEMSSVVAVTDGELLYHATLFDPDDSDAAFAELTARWIASGEVEHPEVIEASRMLFEAANRHEWDVIANHLRDATYISHRQLGLDDGDISDYLASLQMWASLVPDLWTEVTEVLAHSAMGVVVHVLLKGTSTDGTAVEIPSIHLACHDGDRITHLETYDPSQRDEALTRFQALNS